MNSMGILKSGLKRPWLLLNENLLSAECWLRPVHQKKLKLSVNSIVGTFGFAVVRVEITLEAETSDGYVNTYIGDNRSPATLYRAADGAVMRAVAEMLRDPRIIDFLKK